MFCKYCGAEISDTAKFCPKCGKKIKVEKKREEIKPEEDTKVIFSVKPVFIVPYKLIVNVIQSLPIFLFFAIIFHELDIEALKNMNFLYLFIIVIIIMAIYLIVKMILESKQYKELEYNFYKTKVEYKDSFLTKEEKEVQYKFVREVELTQNVLERLFGIGTIRIYTNASTGTYNAKNHENIQGRNGIYLHCIENVEEQYKIIKKTIEESKIEK